MGKKYVLKSKKNSNFLKNTLILGVILFVSSILAGLVISSYLIEIVNAEELQSQKDIEKELKQNLQKINELTEKSSIEYSELQKLKQEIEETLDKSRERKNKIKYMPLITLGNY